eukprot:Cvel_32101.t1-p1 / transcript=Cvel_32101.t1 / gene=Cvel_32101 / organism=Chromera_velia_CCMP2878 / gene_product=hypothetical protein / transcript_product=hypothetical protein / location=Cvel_scaffold4915:1106-1695(-) / protein_length=196 / sequence_SO=supercontig / SO=protein_coding / is_pseudo=false
MRGWTTFETFVAGFKPQHLIHALPLVSSKGGGVAPSSAEAETAQPEERGGEGERSVHQEVEILTPAAPDVFYRILDTKTFTNGSDKERVKEGYRRFIEGTAGTIKRVSFRGRSSFGDQDAQTLGGLFGYLLSLRERARETLPSSRGTGGLSPFPPQPDPPVDLNIEILDLSQTAVSDLAIAQLIKVLRNAPWFKHL